jgi:long-chain fatty acid transport protein
MPSLLRPRALAAPATRLAGALALALTLAPSAAWASGLDAPMVGSGQSGPTTRDGAAIHWNPANLAYMKKGEFFGGLMLVVGDIRYQRDYRSTYQTPDTLEFKSPVSPENIDPNKMGFGREVKANPVAPLGNIFVVLPPIKNRLVFGLGLYVPYGAPLKFDRNGPQALQLQQAFIVASHITASAGVRLHDMVSLGAGVSYVLGFAELAKKQDFGSVAEFGEGLNKLGQENSFGPNAPSDVRELDTLSRPIALKKAFSHGVSFNVGVTVNPTKKLTLTLAYQHGAKMRYRGKFAIDMNDPFFTQDLAAQGLKFKPLVQGDATLEFNLPKRITLGAAYDINERWRVDGFFQYVRYSEVDAFKVITKSPDLVQEKLGIGDTLTVTLPRDWKDTVWVEGNVRFRPTTRLLTSATLGYQSPASPDKTVDTASPDGHRIIGGVGGGFDVSERVSLLADARFQGIVPRHVTTSDYDLGNGTYKLFLATIAGHLKIRF